MGYACPVCETPQRDGEHLAHHLAFTAMLHGDDHEAWLNERVPNWGDRDPAGLAADVTPHAETAEYHEVFEDTVDRGRPNVGVGAHGHAGRDRGHSSHAHAHAQDPSARTGVVDEHGATDPETAEALREAREMTREMRDGDDSVSNDSNDSVSNDSNDSVSNDGDRDDGDDGDSDDPST
ncbi:DUF5810 domain-containing protein [Halorubrum trueperi]|uniref:DUF5810 domain-containing protein n=1 Tax=Halorubrum trueperi TaxID=2004704 RepID=A0ABD5UI79_9EURY